jgi:hypothetical protein
VGNYLPGRQRLRGAARLRAHSRGRRADRPADHRATGPRSPAGARGSSRDRPATRRHRCHRGATAADRRDPRPPRHPRHHPRVCATGCRASAVGRDPSGALAGIQGVLPLLKTPDLTIVCGRLLAAGMRACADLAERARARRDEPAAAAARAAAYGLVSWVGQMNGAPFTDHVFVATIPAERATWHAERTRLTGASDPDAWSCAGQAWQELSCPHRAGYAWSRQAQAQLGAGQPAAEAAGPLRAAAAAAEGHMPLLERVRLLAGRAGIPRQGALHQPKNRQRARQQHPAQTRGVQPGPGRGRGRGRTDQPAAPRAI